MSTAELLSTKTKKQHISQNMRRLGKGSSRVVYETEDNHTVVKYAIKNNKGVAQNRTEYEIYENAKYYINLLCPVIDISDNSKTLIMGKAIPLRNKNMPVKYKEKVHMFKKKLEFIRLQLSCYVGNQKPPMPSKIRKDILKQVLNKEEKNLLRSRLFLQICELISHYNVLVGDIIDETSWGVYKGRFVLLDYGCTREVFNKHYKIS